MGSGIAQIAAVAGHPVKLLDAREGAAASAIEGIARNSPSWLIKAASRQRQHRQRVND
jgi:3-hydroxybutyryl-CoA dehydrogenase